MTESNATNTSASGFSPKIGAILCNWCSYAGADLAGVSRLQYPPQVRIIRVMCSGRIDPHIVLEAFINGIDGLFIGGCHPGDCHYLEGNLNAERKIKMTKKLLKKTGLEPNRLRMEWVSASEGQVFAEFMKDFTKQIQELGPSPLSGTSHDQRIMADLIAAKEAASDFRLRAIVAKEYKIVAKEGNVYGEFKTQENWDEFLDDAIEMEFELKQILGHTRNDPLSVKELATKINLPTDKILEYIVYLKGKNLIALDSIEGITPRYLAMSFGGD
jgi:coenzyme F420-reducing hydrogenase delta subunit